MASLSPEGENSMEEVVEGIESLRYENESLRHQLEMVQAELRRLKEKEYEFSFSSSLPSVPPKSLLMASFRTSNKVVRNSIERVYKSIAMKQIEYKSLATNDSDSIESDKEENDAEVDDPIEDGIYLPASGSLHHRHAHSPEYDKKTLDIDDAGSEDMHLPHNFEPISFQEVIKSRAGWLVGLMVLQSCSSFILKRNEELLEDHSEIVQFLTMLVGAGGNAGNQASVRVIRGLALGTLNSGNLKTFLIMELKMMLCLSMILATSGFIRAIIFQVHVAETIAITLSLFCIVAISIFIGVLLPLSMKFVGIDPAHSSTTIQVIMDILGVCITVRVSAAILETSLGGIINSFFYEY